MNQNLWSRAPARPRSPGAIKSKVTDQSAVNKKPAAKKAAVKNIVVGESQNLTVSSIYLVLIDWLFDWLVDERICRLAACAHRQVDSLKIDEEGEGSEEVEKSGEILLCWYFVRVVE